MKYLKALSCCFFLSPCFCQHNNTFYILQNICIEGNKKTKDFIILREIDVSINDTILPQQTSVISDKTRSRLINTGLFLEVNVLWKQDSNQSISLFISVIERFYTYALPQLDLADRNFNEWWQDRNRDLRRLDYGFDIKQKNIRGRNETLTLRLVAGFNQKAEMYYSIPYIDKNLRTGITFNIGYITNKQVAYRSFQHKLDFYEHPSTARTRFTSGFSLMRRNKFYALHTLSTSLNYNTVADTITRLNPDYFLHESARQFFISLRYTYVYDRRDRFYYPTKGYYIRVETEMLGMKIFTDLNMYSMYAEWNTYVPLSKRLYFASGIRTKSSLPTLQPYYNQRGLGYKNYWVSGFERYVIDGQHYGLIKTNLKLKIFETVVRQRFIRSEKFNKQPWELFLKWHNDAAYVVDNTINPNNSTLSNRWIAGTGLGLDLVTYYDIVIRMEYSMNSKLESGFFLHMKAAI
ncbi:MAG: BamA/TamA family outer membrane protein [Cytophagaceae bacterium]|nr:BamA/TamA family outer membrane protein [Cytophagaceae bacterium]MDW8456764.1 BamA/TamA family outer membrane protein [Cytophagaceae bacterium]